MVAGAVRTASSEGGLRQVRPGSDTPDPELEVLPGIDTLDRELEVLPSLEVLRGPSRPIRALASEFPQQPDDGVEGVGDPLLERDDAVVGDVDVLGTDLGEALVALVELLDAIDVLLHHPVGAVGLRRLEAERRHLLGLLVVEGHVGHEVANQREGPDRRHRDGLAGLEQVHAGHAHEARLAVDLGAARPALAGLAVPPAGEVVGLGRLDPVDDVEDDHALLGLDAIVLEVAATGVTAEHAHRDGRHHFLSWKSVFSSAGISSSGSRLSASAPCLWRMTTLILPHASSVYGWSSRVWPPRLSLRSSAPRVQHSATVSSEARSSAVCQPGL